VFFFAGGNRALSVGALRSDSRNGAPAGSGLVLWTLRVASTVVARETRSLLASLAVGVVVAPRSVP